jgi:hypothetical protein
MEMHLHTKEKIMKRRRTVGMIFKASLAGMEQREAEQRARERTTQQKITTYFGRDST